MLGIGFAASVTTQAQYQNDQWQRQRQREYEREQRRRQREYERAQRRQQRQSERYGYGNNGGYNNSGYYGGYGNNGRYNNDNYSNYGGSYEFRQTALNAGYNAGVKAGRDDRNRGRSFNYADESEYRNGDKDYNSRYGNRAMYQQYFREAFVNGYSDGYRGY
jgi:type II secretory pathway pseudopilin PulG